MQRVTKFTSSTGPAIKEQMLNYSGNVSGYENNFCPVGNFNPSMSSDMYYCFTTYYSSGCNGDCAYSTLDDCYWRAYKPSDRVQEAPWAVYPPTRVGPQSMDMDTYNAILATNIEQPIEVNPITRLQRCRSTKKTPWKITTGFTPLSTENSLNFTSTPLYFKMSGISIFQYPNVLAFKNTMTTLAETNYGQLNGYNMYEGSFSVNGNNYTQFHNMIWNDDHTFAIDTRNIPLPFSTAWHYTSMFVGAFYVVTKDGTCYSFKNIQPMTNQNVALRIVIDINGSMSIALKDITYIHLYP